MDKPTIQTSFIWQWLEKASLDERLNQSVIDAIKNSMSGINNENLDETELLQALLKLANGENKNV